MNTKVELRFNILESVLLSDEEKQLVLEYLKSKVTALGEWIIVSQSERSQLKNKEKAIEKFYTILEKALIKPKQRIETSIPVGINEQRLEQKKLKAEKKDLRKKINSH